MYERIFWLIYAGSETGGGAIGEGVPTDSVHHLDAEESRDGCRPPDR